MRGLTSDLGSPSASQPASAARLPPASRSVPPFSALEDGRERETGRGTRRAAAVSEISGVFVSSHG